MPTSGQGTMSPRQGSVTAQGRQDGQGYVKGCPDPAPGQELRKTPWSSLRPRAASGFDLLCEFLAARQGGRAPALTFTLPSAAGETSAAHRASQRAGGSPAGGRPAFQDTDLTVRTSGPQPLLPCRSAGAATLSWRLSRCTGLGQKPALILHLGIRPWALPKRQPSCS